MLLTVKKWGNSAAIRLPAKVLNAAQVGIEQRVNVHVQGRRIVIDPALDDDDLDTLLTQITPENVHDEVSFGPPAGKESF
ncbi:MAG: AbrB/MazE/SpoVT family DNA-binding domain-containing protein [Gammaproteobacteria bacterium]|nr:AbrB/MazE/SpoVT family DNA-binding domain-containing protein [Gammaproteobacteria bacterium]MDE0284671.1 AbrB/MazE/SpoVT family DNA-binding domain-containing protein [Gammaproteobacteria bacterium]MDE0510270.1 AbrB/MazE/SpoVT family DNA-binding domain-containing protein [Gammaproteobacteria bacterium]